MKYQTLLVVLAGCHASGLSSSSDMKTDMTATIHTGEPMWHRPTASACTTPSPAGDCQPYDDMYAGYEGACHSDDDCPGAHCFGIRSGTCACSLPDCSSDSDCATDEVCGCAAQLDPRFETNHCVKANCHVDADCGPGQYCAASVDYMCGYFFGVTRYACTTTEDTCRTDADCGGDGRYSETPGDPYCTYYPELGHRACSSVQCAG